MENHDAWEMGKQDEPADTPTTVKFPGVSQGVETQVQPRRLPELETKLGVWVGPGG